MYFLFFGHTIMTRHLLIAWQFLTLKLNILLIISSLSSPILEPIFNVSHIVAFLWILPPLHQLLDHLLDGLRVVVQVVYHQLQYKTLTCTENGYFHPVETMVSSWKHVPKIQSKSIFLKSMRDFNTGFLFDDSLLFSRESDSRDSIVRPLVSLSIRYTISSRVIKINFNHQPTLFINRL